MTEVICHRDQTVVMNRRELVKGLAAGYVVALTGCTYSEELGRSQLMMVSDEQMAQLAANAWAGVRQQSRISSNTEYNRQLNRVGRRIVDASGAGHRDWEFLVFEQDQVNAFVMPNGKVGFYEGIMGMMDNDDQVAAVMGHEVGHMNARHAAERYSQQMAAGIGLTVASVALAASDVENAPQISGILGAGVTFGILLPYSRHHELEADRLGINYMHRARYNPREALTFWERKAAKSPTNVPTFMSTHPSDAQRIAVIKEQIRTLGI